MISIVINCDTRAGSEENESHQNVMMNGTRSYDFLCDGIINKHTFFRDYPHELILFIDKHLDIPPNLSEKWNSIPNLTVCQSKHREFFDTSTFFPKWNDINFLQALYLARGEYIAHFDGDTNAYRQDSCKIIDEMIKLLDQYSYISYPSRWSPAPDCNAGNEWDYWWASTRFFFCKRSALNFTEIEKCLRDSNYLYTQYGEKRRKCPWLEHILGIIAGEGKVYYPPIDLDNYAIFSWSSYKKGVLQHLNSLSYTDVRNFIIDRGGIQYPNDISS